MQSATDLIYIVCNSYLIARVIKITREFSNLFAFYDNLKIFKYIIYYFRSFESC